MPRFLPTCAAIALTVASSSLAAPLFVPAPPPQTDQRNPVVASDGADFLTVWTEQGKVRAARVSHTGALLDPTALDFGTGVPLAAAYGAGTYLVIYETFDNLANPPTTDLFAVRIKRTGELDSGPLHVIGEQSDFFRSIAASVAFDGQRFFATWTTRGTVRGIFIAPDLSSSALLTLAVEPKNVAYVGSSIAWDGHRFLVVWSTAANTGICVDPCIAIPMGVAAIRVGADGTPLDSAPTQIATGDVRSEGVVASNGHDFMIALYRQSYDSIAGNSDVRAVIIDAETSLAIRATLVLSNWFVNSATVAWNGSAYEVGWSYRTASPTDFWIADAQIDRSGNIVARHVTASIGAPTSIAANAGGDVVFAVNGRNAAASYFGAAVYFDRDLITPLPAPPPAPVIASNGTSVVWSGGDGVDGYAIEAVIGGGVAITNRILGSAERSVALADLRAPLCCGIGVPKGVRVRAFNLGGFSEPSNVIPLAETPRRRPAAH